MIEILILAGIIVAAIMAIFLITVTVFYLIECFNDWRAKRAFQRRQEDYKKRI